MQIRIEHSKGAKDRYTILSETALQLLRQYWKMCRPNHWLFPGMKKDKPISYKGISLIFNIYKKQAGKMSSLKNYKTIEGMQAQITKLNINRAINEMMNALSSCELF